MIFCANSACGRETTNPKYCSQSCAAVVNNHLVPKRIKVVRSVKPARTRLSEEEQRTQYNEKMAPYMTERYHRRRAATIEQLGGRCALCGATDDLQIDHIDRTQKSFPVGAAFAGWSNERLAKELAKCQVLCTPCHKAKTSAEAAKRANPRHGTHHMYQNHHCRCDECRAFVGTYNRMRKARKKAQART